MEHVADMLGERGTAVSRDPGVVVSNGSGTNSFSDKFKGETSSRERSAEYLTADEGPTSETDKPLLCLQNARSRRSKKRLRYKANQSQKAESRNSNSNLCNKQNQRNDSRNYFIRGFVAQRGKSPEWN